MKILHVSDLHFGAHNENLQSSLVDRVAEIKPDVIICTGDLADNPKEELLATAFDYLNQLQGHCAPDPQGAKGRPRLIVIPGNHDYRVKGFLWRPRNDVYARVLDGLDSDVYLEPENVWIFGFDSAQDGSLGGSGSVSDQDIKRFHDRYEELHRTRARFDGAFKIAAVHHHPFPVNWDFTEKDRWLTMVNAGRFLSAILFRRIDLVLHGHEHLQAHARVSSSLGANDHEATIVSLGATLRKVHAPARNWFGVVHVAERGVDVDFYASVGAAFGEAPESQRFCVRSRSQSAELEFERWAAQSGYSYRALASIAAIDKDGDARRSVECEDLRITRENCERARRHPVEIPWTSGYVDKLRVEGASVTVTPAKNIAPGSRAHSFETALEFGHRLSSQETVTYNYHWNAINAFAMNQREFDYMYPSGTESEDLEFTHYIVADPTEALTVVVKFPEGFAPPKIMRARVREFVPKKSAREWIRNDEAEERVKREHALRYYDSLNIAALRVAYPRQGLSYGIEWSLPAAPPNKMDEPAANVEELRRTWLSREVTAQESAWLSELMVRLAIVAREALMKRSSGETWPGDVEASFMFLDQSKDRSYKLRPLCAVVDEDGNARPVQYDFELGFGDGVAGRAFKTNQIRIYAPWEGNDSDGPEYYKPFPDGPVHRVLASFPVQPPDPNAEPRSPYGVFSLGSTRADCPLRLAGAADPKRANLLDAFRVELNQVFYEALVKIFLLKKPAVDTAHGGA